MAVVRRSPIVVLLRLMAAVSLAALATGVGVTPAVAVSGAAWAWGSNSFGQLGDGTILPRLTPVAVSMPAGVTFSTIAAGWGHSQALDSGGAAWAWGANNQGQLGDGTTTDRSTPVAVSMPAGVTFSAIAGGEAHSLALDISGQAWAWGWNGLGQLGDGTTTTRLTPVPVSMPAGVTFSAIAGNRRHSLALDSGGAAWAWGLNDVGQLGDGTTTNRLSPVPVSMPAGVTFSAIAAGYNYGLALDISSQAWGWGYNASGQLGDGTGITRLTPVPVSMPAGVTFSAIAAGWGHSLALDSGGAAWAWGVNFQGQLGDGTTTNRLAPVAVSMPAGVTFSAIAGGEAHTLALDIGGQGWAWGYNGQGQLGDGTTTDRSTPVAVSMPAGVTFSAIASGQRHSLALEQ